MLVMASAAKSGAVLSARLAVEVYIALCSNLLFILNGRTNLDWG